MKEFIMQKTTLAILAASATLLGCLNTTRSAHAEGGNITLPGVHGVIRIVRSNGSLAAINQDVSTSADINLSCYQPINVAGQLDAETDPFNNKSSAYLGGTAVNASNIGREVDAGLQLETGVFGGYLPTGWSAFIGYEFDLHTVDTSKPSGLRNVYVTPKLYSAGSQNGLEWRGGSFSPIQDPTSGKWLASTGLINTSMQFTILHGGSHTLNVDGLGTFYWNPNIYVNGSTDPAIKPTIDHPVAPWGADVFNSSDQRNAIVKHEIAQTRGTYEATAKGDFGLDGSWVRGTWSNCKINGVDWTANKTNQTRTGFSAPANGTASDGAWDKRVNGQKIAESHTIVEFTPQSTDNLGGLTVDNITARQGSHSSSDAPGDADRYKRETTIINLGTATRPTGTAVEWP